MSVSIGLTQPLFGQVVIKLARCLAYERLSLLESLTSSCLCVFLLGTESETKEFMAVCVETVNKYPLNDFISPVFIFERLCSIIYPVSKTFS